MFRHFKALRWLNFENDKIKVTNILIGKRMIKLMKEAMSTVQFDLKRVRVQGRVPFTHSLIHSFEISPSLIHSFDISPSLIHSFEIS